MTEPGFFGGLLHQYITPLPTVVPSSNRSHVNYGIFSLYRRRGVTICQGTQASNDIIALADDWLHIPTHMLPTDWSKITIIRKWRVADNAILSTQASAHSKVNFANTGETFFQFVVKIHMLSMQSGLYQENSDGCFP